MMDCSVLTCQSSCGERFLGAPPVPGFRVLPDQFPDEVENRLGHILDPLVCRSSCGTRKWWDVRARNEHSVQEVYVAVTKAVQIRPIVMDSHAADTDWGLSS